MTTCVFSGVISVEPEPFGKYWWMRLLVCAFDLRRPTRNNLPTLGDFYQRIYRIARPIYLKPLLGFKAQ